MDQKLLTDFRSELLDSRFGAKAISTIAESKRFPLHEMRDDVAFQIINDELYLDGNARQNLATFCQTWDDENVHKSDLTVSRLQLDRSSMCEFGPLWLDDFGTGMANFSALSEVRYDYIKIARELFVMLRQSPEGRTLFSQLLHLMNRYCRGVIVEGVETPEEWRDVQNSPAFAAQGWFLSRPAPIETLNTAVLAL